MQRCLLSMDFKKAFDRVWHKGLIFKLAQCGVSPSSLSWIENYLTNRLLEVHVNGSNSSPQPTFAGVPQGSHLGPVLFVVFINDLPATTATADTDLYADDALLHQHLPKHGLSLLSLQQAVTSAAQWAKSWHGRFGCDKTTMMTTLPNCEPLSMDNGTINIAANHKHLGVTITARLNWHDHVNNLVKSANQRAGLLRWMARDLRPDTIKQLYIYYLRPKLEYASPVWNGCILERDAVALERIQAAVARAILRAPHHTPKTQLLQQLDFPSLRWRREIDSLALFHHLLQTRPSPLDSCLYPFSCTINTRSLRKPHQLILPRAHTNKFLNSFFYRSALVWNTLPAFIQNITCRKKFKQAIHTLWSDNKFSISFCPI